MTLEQLKKHCWIDERGDHQMPVDEVKAPIDSTHQATVEEIIKIANGMPAFDFDGDGNDLIRAIDLIQAIKK